jgi:hypothetical protein
MAFMTFHILGITILTDELIFFRENPPTNQAFMAWADAVFVLPRPSQSSLGQWRCVPVLDAQHDVFDGPFFHQ